MQTHPWGPGGWPVAKIGQGTWHLEQADHEEVIRTLRRGVDLGLRHIDTAEMYGDGATEKLVGEALEGMRQDVFLVSKVLPINASFTRTRRACEQSLRRLRTDYLDCYLLHWRGPTPLEDTFSAFEVLMDEGKIRSWGVSNFDASDLAEARAVAGDGRMSCDQVLYHLEERTVDSRVLPWCETHGVALVGYSPFGSGHFPSPETEGGRVLLEIAAAYSATPRQVALAFLTRSPWLFTIPKASTVAHVEENAGAGRLQLSPEALEMIDQAFAYTPSEELPML